MVDKVKGNVNCHPFIAPHHHPDHGFPEEEKNEERKQETKERSLPLPYVHLLSMLARSLTVSELVEDHLP